MQHLSLPASPFVSILGDSISTLKGSIPSGWRCYYESEHYIDCINTPQDTWWGIVSHVLNGTVLANSSFSGSTVEGWGFPAGSSDNRIKALSTLTKTPDIIFVYMGINDFGWGGALNQALGQSVSASECPQDILNSNTTLLTVGHNQLDAFSSSYTHTLTRIHSLFPHAIVCCISLMPCVFEAFYEDAFISSPRGISLSLYNEAIRNASHQTDSIYIDTFSYQKSYQSCDGLHPSSQGMHEIAALITDALCQQPFIQQDVIVENWQHVMGMFASSHPQDIIQSMTPFVSNLTCTSCEGCNYSPITKSGWGLQCEKRVRDNACRID